MKLKKIIAVLSLSFALTNFVGCTQKQILAMMMKCYVHISAMVYLDTQPH